MNAEKSRHKKLESFEITCYRKILRISWTQHRTNESVFEELGTSRELLETIKKRKLQYFGHVIRAQNLCTHFLEGRINGKRGRGRSRRRWLDYIKQWTGKSVAECTTTARDRNQWIELVYASVVPDLQT